MRTRNIPILSASQALASCGPPVVVLLGGILGVELAPSPSLATLPISLMVVGVALFTIPAAVVMKKIGRRRGFMGGAFMAAMAALLAAYAIADENFYLLCVGTLFIGANGAFVQQYRFAASESVEPHYSSRAVSFVLLGGIFAGFLGPEIAKRTSDWLPTGLYTGTFIFLALIYIVVVILLGLFRDTLAKHEQQEGEGRSLIQIVSQRSFQVAVLAATIAYGVMTFVMTATPVYMHNLSGFSLDQTAMVIQSHIVAMYLPSLITGFLMARLGLLRVMFSGIGALFFSIVFAVFSLSLAGYWISLVLLGIGWNFLFVGGTVLLTHSYRPIERFKSQATNDFAIFGSQAVASLSAGTVLFLAGWDILALVTLPFLLLVFLAVLLFRQSYLPTLESV